jgi:hypothetical protein
VSSKRRGLTADGGRAGGIAGTHIQQLAEGETAQEEQVWCCCMQRCST